MPCLFLQGGDDMNVGYVRVSTVDQNEARQLEALKPYRIERVFSEKVSGASLNRPKLQELMEFVRKGDTVYVEDFSRLARTTMDLLGLINQLQEKGVTVVSLKENLDTSTPTGELMLTMIAAINQFERQIILERQSEGIALAKAAGKYTGRKKIEIPNFEKYYIRYQNRELSKSGLAKELGVSRPTIDRLINEYILKAQEENKS